MRRGLLLLLGVLLAFQGSLPRQLAVATRPAASHRGTPPAVRQEIYQRSPLFTLTTQDGERLALQDLTGRVVLINFIYTSCPDVCPVATAKFARLQRFIKGAGLEGQVFLLSITTDAEVDTPSVLKEYGRRYGAEFTHWAFLTGSRTELTQTRDAFGVVTVERARGDIDHTSMTFLLDRRGRIRLIYLGYGWQEEDVVADMATLLRQPFHLFP